MPAAHYHCELICTAHPQSVTGYVNGLPKTLPRLLAVPQVHSDKHGFGSGYTGYGSKTKLNEVGGMGVADAGASEDSIDLMVSH